MELDQSESLIIIGAGASVDFGLPVGSKLRDLIIGLSSDRQNKRACEKKLKEYILEKSKDSYMLRDDINWKPLEFCDGNFNKGLKVFIRKFKKTEKNTTIDSFLENNEDMAHLGKFLIGYIIFFFQFVEYLNPKDKPGQWHDLLKDKWYYRLFNNYRDIILKHQDSPNELKNNFPLIITFNYDTFFEWSLYLWLRYELKLSIEKSEQISNWISNDHLRHVYGKISDIPSETIRTPVPHDDMTPEVIDHIRKTNSLKQKHFRERFNHPAIFRNVKRVLFLGFGFDEANTWLLINTFFDQFKKRPSVHGTNWGIKDNKKLREHILNLSFRSIDIQSEKFSQKIEASIDLFFLAE